MKFCKRIVSAALAVSLASCASNVITTEPHDGYTLVYQSKGPTLGYSPDSGVEIIEHQGYAFKDLNKDGKLDVFEDWRKDVKRRAADLASQLTEEEICGLIFYASAVDINSTDLTKGQLSLLEKDNIRHLLIRNVSSPATAAAWTNTLQAWCEAQRMGIPANNSTDPRNYTSGSANINANKPELDGEFDPAGQNDISKWPREMGLAATFDMDVIRSHGEVASKEYRALGITTALSPEIDIATDPRWRRFHGTFSEDPALCRDIAIAYCEAFQNTPGSKDGWGSESVNCMVKHWPGGGSGEGGRDAHFGMGKYAVYPGSNFDAGLIPFVDGAFRLPGKTRTATAVMPYYTISYNQDPSGENVGNGFSHYIIQDLLRGKHHFDGVVCTDWGIVRDYDVPWVHSGKPWGVEKLSVAERRLRCFEAGVDQLGGTKDNSINMEAWRLWAEKYGEKSAREHFELSARRILVNTFRVGLFENPYLDPDYAAVTVGCKEFVAAGYDAQLKSIVMLKNTGGALPARGPLKVYEPLRHVDDGVTHWQKPAPAYDEYPISKELLGRYFQVVETPGEADFAIVTVKSPAGHWGYITPNEEYPQGHYCPISLQWGPYKATTAREHSIAADPDDGMPDRSYRDIEEISSNARDAIMVRETKEAMGGKPVIVVVAAERPFVPAEIEPWADALLFCCGVSNNAVLDIVCGAAEPYGLLPCQLPANMETVEAQCEDVPRDMDCYKDSEGNLYDFAFGLNWNGVINDARVERYK